jgi:glycosyltransferase involved in cell wall biosynthesis
LAHQENAPCQIQEALACGTPVLAFSVGGIPEMLREGETGFLVSWDERAQLGGCVREKILRKINNLSTMQDSSRRDAVGRYSEEILGPQLQAFLGRLAG